MTSVTSTSFGGADVEVARVEAALLDAGIVFGPPSEVVRTVYDTFDGRLHAAGLRLEQRLVDGRGAELVLGTAGGVPAHVPLRRPLPESTPVSTAALPGGPLRARVALAAGERVLLPLVTVAARRRSGERPGPEGAPSVVVAVDIDVVVVGAPVRPRWAVEVQELPGFAKPAARLRRALAATGAAPLEGDALELAFAAAAVDPTGWSMQQPRLRRPQPALAGFRAVFRAGLDAMDAHWQGTVEHLDPEFLHQLRIAVRRTRSVLREADDVLPAELRRVHRDAFAWLGDVTGAARDLDVYVAGWAELTSALPEGDRAALDPVRAHLLAARDSARAELSTALRSERAIVLVDAWREWLDEDDAEVVGGGDAASPLGEVVAARIARAQRRLLRHGRAIDPDSPAEALHALRRDAKRLRYLLEGFGALGGRRRTRAVLRHLKDLQDNLGEHQDVEVQALRLRDAVAAVGAMHPGRLDAAAVAAAERLASDLGERKAVARAAFADRFAAYDAKATRGTVDDLIDRMRS